LNEQEKKAALRGVVEELRAAAQDDIDSFSKAFPFVTGEKLRGCTGWARDLRGTATTLEMFYGLRDFDPPPAATSSRS